MSKLNNKLPFPLELQFEIALQLPILDLLQLCQVSHYYNDICNDEQFWKEKTFYDFKDYAGNKLTHLTWKEYYIYLYNESLLVPIFLNNDHISDITIFRHQAVSEVFNTLSEKYNNTFFVFTGHNLNILARSFSIPPVTVDKLDNLHYIDIYPYGEGDEFIKGISFIYDVVFMNYGIDLSANGGFLNNERVIANNITPHIYIPGNEQLIMTPDFAPIGIQQIASRVNRTRSVNLTEQHLGLPTSKNKNKYRLQDKRYNYVYHYKRKNQHPSSRNYFY